MTSKAKGYYNEHKEQKYRKCMDIIDNNIVHVWVETENGIDIALDHMDIDLLERILQDLNHKDTKFHILYNLNHISSITYNYKYAITKLLFHLSPSIGIIAFYNISPSINAVIQIFDAITPRGIAIIQEKTYNDAIKKIKKYKNNEKEICVNNNVNSDNDALYLHCFLEGCARLSWLNMYDQPLTIPPKEHPFHLIFQAFDSLREDMIIKEKKQLDELTTLHNKIDQAIQDKNIALNAQKELFTKKIKEKEDYITTLLNQISQNLHIEKTAIEHQRKHKKRITALLSLITSSEIEEKTKKSLLFACNKILDHEKEQNKQISDVDKHFMTQLQLKFPFLTHREVYTCLLITKNFNSNEIAQEIEVTERGAETFRYRIHKKLSLKKHQSLKNFLLSLNL